MILLAVTAMIVGRRTADFEMLRRAASSASLDGAALSSLDSASGAADAAGWRFAQSDRIGATAASPDVDALEKLARSWPFRACSPRHFTSTMMTGSRVHSGGMDRVRDRSVPHVAEMLVAAGGRRDCRVHREESARRFTRRGPMVGRRRADGRQRRSDGGGLEGLRRQVGRQPAYGSELINVLLAVGSGKHA
ncbi:hypothetical protein O7607_00560 [Micromonospora sp. WMMA1949]|uniref:hypothetical protein n=1 Tax=Micromonospora sp. WMMA1949 TaxID=3015162 RepID=UPI0022B69422|nr:hypothetical protein [Micromonospora sp. WMMA1949]MCZ7424211.1 hypothetical protein [Micromonospora sp. WMMA1949]